MASPVAVAVEEVAAPADSERRQARLTRVVAGLTAAKVFGAASGFVTGPLLARSLGASGRGDLAAITVPLSLLPAVLTFGIPAFAFRSLPKGQAPSDVIPSLGVPLVMIGFLSLVGAVPIADALAGGRGTVRLYLIVVFLTMPLQLLASLLSSSLAALQRWSAVAATIVIPFGVALVGIVTLYATGRLTVGPAAAVTIAGSVLSLAPGIPLLISVTRPRFRLELARRAISFGLKSWAGGLALLANLRLDQFLMITLVTPRVLGLYAVATTLAGATSLATGALTQPMMTRVARGETELMPRAVRMALIVTLGLNLALAAITPVLLTVLFGHQFRAAIPMALVLLVGAVPYGTAMVLSSGLQADGAPLIPSIGEGLALVITVVGLILLLGPLGGIGAAIVSVAAYSTSFLFQLAMARRRIGVPLREFLVPSRADVRWARALLIDAAFMVRSIRPSASGS